MAPLAVTDMSDADILHLLLQRWHQRLWQDHDAILAAFDISQNQLPTLEVDIANAENNHPWLPPDGESKGIIHHFQFSGITDSVSGNS